MQPNEWRLTMRSTVTAIGIGILVLMAPAPVFANDDVAKDPAKAYAKAVFVESVEGDLAAAIDLYRQIANASATPSDVEYRARVRMISCQRRLGRLEDAKASEATLAQRFPDRATLTSQTKDTSSGVDGQTAHLIEQLGDPSEEVREQARKELSWFGDLVVPQLEDAIRGGNVFRSVGSATALVYLSRVGELASPALVRAVEDDNVVIRRNTLRGILKARSQLDSSVNDALIERIMTDPDSQIRTSAATALRSRSSDSLHEHAVAMFESAEPSLRRWLLNNTTGAPLETLRAMLERGLEDPSASVREYAMDPALALESRHGDVERALQAALRLIADTDDDVRCAALRIANPGVIDRHPEVADDIVKLVTSRAEDPSVKVRLTTLDHVETLASSVLDVDQRGSLYASLPSLCEGVPLHAKLDTLRRVQNYERHPAIIPWILDGLRDRYLYLEALRYIRARWSDDWPSPVIPALEGFDDDPVEPSDQQVQARMGYGSRRGASDLTRAIGHYGTPEQLETIFEFRDRRSASDVDRELVEDIDNAIRHIVKRTKETLTSEQWSLVIDRIGEEQREGVLKQLAETRRPELIPAYIEWLDETSDADFLKALADFVDRPEVTDAIAKIATDTSRSEYLRVLCASYLLDGASDRGESTRVAAEVVRSIGSTRRTDSLIVDLAKKRPEPELLRELCELDSRFTRGVYEAWSQRLGDEADVPVDRRIIEIGLTSEHPEVRRAALVLLAALGDESWLDGVVRLTKDESFHVRNVAARALGSFRAADAIPVLVEMLRDSSSDVRDSAKDALERIRFYAEQKAWWDEWKATGGVKSGVAAILPMLDHESPEVRLRAIRSLGSIGSPEALPRLLQMLESGDEAARSAAADAIDRINEAPRGSGGG